MDQPVTATPAPAPAPPPARPAARAGQLTPGWRLVTGATWATVFVAFSGLWKVSRELGLATWWLGPPADQRPLVVVLLPFVAPTAMVMATLNNVRRLPWCGLVASAVTAAVGFGDLTYIHRLAYVEIAMGVAAALVSVASLAGMYRSIDPH